MYKDVVKSFYLGPLGPSADEVLQRWWMMGLRDRALCENEWIRSVYGKLADELAKWMETRKEVDSLN